MRGNGFSLSLVSISMLLSFRLASAGEAALVTELGSAASRSPCAVLGLLQVLGEPQFRGEGMLHIDEPPSAQKVLGVLREFGINKESALSAGLQRNPYSSAVAVVRIKWWTQFQSGSAAVVTFHAQYVDRSGAPLYGDHLLEPVLSVEISDRGVRVLTDGETHSTRHQASRSAL
jgi:hypothetical protein